MWLDSSSCELETTVAFTGDHKAYGEWMGKVVDTWPFSCENALTNYKINRKAWLGHAAAALAIGATQAMTRKAWAFLDDRQRALANREAARHIGSWENRYIESQRIHQPMGKALLF